MRPPVRPPRLRCGLFPSIYLPHLLVLPATFGLRCFLPSYPYFPALYVVSVRQVRGLPTASSRFHLTMDTLAVQLCASSLPTRTRDFHPLEPAHGGRTKKRRNGRFHLLPLRLFLMLSPIWLYYIVIILDRGHSIAGSFLKDVIMSIFQAIQCLLQ